MRVGYFDCFCGASGDMILGALVGAGLRPDDLRADVARLRLDDYELNVSDIRKQGFAAVRVEVKLTGKPGHRHLHQIVKIIDDADLEETIKHDSKRIFTRLAEAEAAVHGSTIEKIHFHEVGAVDAMVNIVGAVCGIRRLGLERIMCSPIPTGSGTVRCEHGVMPVPAPGTAKLLEGVPLAACDEPGELTTPTGAAVLTTLAESYGPLPAMRIERTGYGAGSRDGQTRPNLLRLIVGETVEAGQDEADEVVVLEVNLDDATGAEIGHVFDALFEAGAVDVFATPIVMKKNRPAVTLSVIAPPSAVQACEDVLFALTPTFGVRRHACTRRKLARSFDTVSTAHGEIRVKVGRRGGRVTTVAPEYDDCARAARARGAALRDVIFEARRAWRDKHGSGG